MANRRMALAFDDYRTDLFQVNNGLDQGDPFSSICYLIYNADILKIPRIEEGESALLFVDDAALVVTGKNFAETHNKLVSIME